METIPPLEDERWTPLFEAGYDTSEIRKWMVSEAEQATGVRVGQIWGHESGLRLRVRAVEPTRIGVTYPGYEDTRGGDKLRWYPIGSWHRLHVLKRQ
jgi:hypothetical protein